MMEHLLKSEDVMKRYMTKRVLDGVTFTLEKGKIYGLFGPNASGKTTLMKILAGLTQPSSGQVVIDGHAVGIASKRRVSYIPTANHLPKWMNVQQCIRYFEDFYDDFDANKAEMMIVAMGLSGKQKISTLSTGMLGRLKLALGLSRDVAIYMLDEPLNGLDAVSRDKIIEQILHACQEDCTFLISSHLINELENTLDEVIFLDKGQITLAGNAEDLRQERKISINDLYKEMFRDA